jgi:hypothetical protein
VAMMQSNESHIIAVRFDNMVHNLFQMELMADG